MSAIAVMLILGGCPWFGHNAQNPVTPKTSVAPQASFTTSAETGLAPLSISFTDTSLAGSEDITTWLWSFDDGYSSDEQSPVHVYEQAGSYQVSLTVTTAIGSHSYTQEEPVSVTQALSSLLISVVDRHGVLISDVAVSSASFNIEQATLSERGVQINVTPSTEDGVMRIKKSGYLDGLLFLEGITGNMQRHVTLIKRAPVIKVNVYDGGRYSGHMGASVEIPPEALQLPDGTIATGVVDLFITPLDTSQPLLERAFPGSFYGAMDSQAGADDQGILLSYGVVDITFELDGQELQLREGMLATLTLPVFSNQDIDGTTLKNNMPVWTLDEQTGIWVYQSEGKLVADQSMPNGIGVETTTSHFTRFNCDINPPGLFRNQGFSGGDDASGGREEPSYVEVIVRITGAEIGKKYSYNHRVYAFGSISSRSRTFFYNGTDISFQSFKDITVRATITDVFDPEISGSDTAVTTDNPTVLNIELSEQPPRFYSTAMRTRAIFGWQMGVATVVKNTIYVGASFDGTSTVLITSPILDVPLILSSGIYHEVEYEISDGDPVSFTLKLVNQHGETEVTEQVAFVDRARPEIGFTWIESTSIMEQVKVQWRNMDGADFAAFYRVSDGQEELLTTVLLNEEDNLSFAKTLTGFDKGDYLRVAFSNSYGTTDIFLPTDNRCPPNTDECFGEY